MKCLHLRQPSIRGAPTFNSWLQVRHSKGQRVLRGPVDELVEEPLLALPKLTKVVHELDFSPAERTAYDRMERSLLSRLLGEIPWALRTCNPSRFTGAWFGAT